MALALFDRVQETTTTTGTGSITLGGAVPGFQSFAVVGNGNTCYYTIVDGSAWEVGVGTYSTSGPTLARTTILSNSNGNTSAITLAAGTKSVFLTYPASKSVNLNESGNVSPLGTVSSGVWQGTTVGVAYGGTGVTASSGANSVVLRDSNQNIAVNRVNQANTNTTAAGGTTALTTASSYIHSLVGTGNQTYTLPDATTLTTGVAFLFNNLATGTLTIANYAGTTVGTVPSGGAAAVFLTLNSTTGGTWDLHAYLPEGVTFGTNAFNLGTSIITGGTWNGGTIATAYGGTGLTTYTSGGAVYANSSSTLTSGTLPTSAGGTGNTSGQAASTASSATFNSGGAGGASGSTFNGSGALTVSYNTIGAPSVSGTNATGTWGISISGNAATATLAATATSAPSYLPLAGGTMSGPLTLYATSGSNSFINGTGDAATLTTYNFALSGWNGMAFYNPTSGGSYPNTTSGVVDFRNGIINMKGGFQVNGSTVLYAGNYNSYAPTLTGTGATGTWAINISGNAATATNASNSNTVANITPPQFFNNMGNEHGTYTNFNSVGDFGFRYLQGSTNGPGTGATQYYGMTIGLGSQFSLSQYASQFYWNRTSTGGNPYVSVRFLEGGSWGSWSKIYAGYADTAGSTDYNALTNKSGGTGSYITSGDYRAPIFYDSNNTNFYVNPEAISSLYGVAIRGDQSPTDSRNQIFFWGAGDTTTSAIGFKANGGEFPNPTGFGDGYNTYLTMDSDGRGWVFRRGVGGSDFTSAYNAGWILNNGVWQANASMRAPIFYDSDNTGFFVDPSNGGFNLRGGTSNRVTYSTNDSGFLVVNAEGNGVSDMRLGAAWGAPGIYSSGNLYLMSGSTTVYWKLNNDDKGYMDNSANLVAYGSSRAPIFYDSNDTGFYLDPNGTSLLKNLALSNYNPTALAYPGSLNIGYTTYNYNFLNGSWPSSLTAGILANCQDQWEFAIHDSGERVVSPFIFVGGGTNYILMGRDIGWGTTFIQAASSFRAPIFYDSDNTGYYTDPASTSALNNLSIASNVGIGVAPGSTNNGARMELRGGGVWDAAFNWTNTGSGGRTWSVFSTNDSFGQGGGRFLLYNQTGSSNGFAVDASNNLTVGGNVTAYGTVSDRRLKHNIREIPTAIAKVLALRPVYYSWNEDTDQHRIAGMTDDLGFIAQDAEEVEPLLVRAGADGMLGLRERGIIALLVKAFQEQDVLIQGLRAEVNALRAH
jgi:hypothetical protein